MAVLLTTVLTAPDPQQHQSLSDYLKVTAHQLHGAANLSTPVTTDDYVAAELEALKQVQRDSFPEESALLTASKPVAKSSRLMSLAPELDEATGLIRVGGRLRRCSDLTATSQQTQFTPSFSIPSTL